MSHLQDKYKAALKFAAEQHKGQKIPDTDLPYLVHVTNVAMEIFVAALQSPSLDVEFAVQVALLHDTVEDTETSYNSLIAKYGLRVADAVLALTKFSNLEKDDQIADSIERIRLLEKEVWAVKLADRITNIDAPAANWDKKKRQKYMETSRQILDGLRDGNQYLADRLQAKIREYQAFVETGDK